MIRILHTSDWHLGHQFHGRRRDREFREFLEFLKGVLIEQSVDVLVVSGDIFDTPSPGNAAARLYYEFLAAVKRETSCRAVIITGGNHDSPSFLNAPATLLDRAFDVKVFGEATKDPADEIVPIHDDAGQLVLLVGAVPYLRDADLRNARFAESPEEREEARREAFKAHFAAVAEAADALRGDAPVPLLLTGHFHAGENDGHTLLPGSADYVALGHIHQCFPVGGKHIRFSGSPLRLNFSDTAPRQMLLVEFEGRKPHITPVTVPDFRRIETLTGQWEELEPKLTAFRQEPEEIYLRLEVTDLPSPELAAKLAAFYTEDRRNHPLIVRSLMPGPAGEEETRSVEELRALTETEVFELLLDSREITDPDMRRELLGSYAQLLTEMTELQP